MNATAPTFSRLSLGGPFPVLPSVHDLPGPSLDELPACELCAGSGFLSEGERCPDCGGVGVQFPATWEQGR